RADGHAGSPRLPRGGAVHLHLGGPGDLSCASLVVWLRGHLPRLPPPADPPRDSRRAAPGDADRGVRLPGLAAQPDRLGGDASEAPLPYRPDGRSPFAAPELLVGSPGVAD